MKHSFHDMNFKMGEKVSKPCMVFMLAALGIGFIVALCYGGVANEKIVYLESELDDVEQQIAALIVVEEEMIGEASEGAEKDNAEEDEENMEELEDYMDDISEETEDVIQEGNPENSEEGVASDKHYTIGETWSVDGLWELTIDGVTATPYYNNDGSYEIIIDYHYTNLGYEDGSSGGLSISLGNSYIGSEGTSVIDENGIVATYYSRAFDIVSPQPATVGATWAAQAKYHILSPVHSAILEYSDNDGMSAIFDLNW